MSPGRAFYRLTSKDVLNDFSLASNAPPPVNGHQPSLSRAYEFFGLLFSTCFARCLKLKLFYGIPPSAQPVVSNVNKKIGKLHTKLADFFGGDEEDRTLDLTDANRTLSQLSYAPKRFFKDRCLYYCILSILSSPFADFSRKTHIFLSQFA